MEIQFTFKEHMSAMLKVLAIISLVVAIVLATSCSYKSDSYNQYHKEKVIIIDSQLPKETMEPKYFQYKVKRIETGVVTYIEEYNKYEVGDTIYRYFRFDE
jgi:hypothetical protein